MGWSTEHIIIKEVVGLPELLKLEHRKTFNGGKPSLLTL
jgi:hypothetical protein